MPGANGVEVTERLSKELPSVGVIVFTAFDRDEQILAAIKAGARGYLLKGAPRDEIFRAIRTVHAGGSLIEPVVASKLLRRMQENSALTTREREVLRLVAIGHANKQIANELSVSERTIKFHVELNPRQARRPQPHRSHRHRPRPRPALTLRLILPTRLLPCLFGAGSGQPSLDPPRHSGESRNPGACETIVPAPFRVSMSGAVDPGFRRGDEKGW